MFLEKILTFVLFLGPLVFFHELGHFFFARLFKVRVEVFSIGFGPKLFRKKYGDTEYAISLIPLGGYVKMFGDDPFNKEAIPDDEKKFSYNHQNKWARFWIVLGGPLTNFILAFFIFYSLLITGEKIPEVKLGAITNQSVLFKSGMRSGDVILKVNGNEVYNPSDLVGDASIEINKVEVRRQLKTQELKLGIRGDVFFEEIMKHPPFLRRPFLVDSQGLKYILSLEKNKINLSLSFEEIGDLTTFEKFYVYKIKDGQDLSIENVQVDLNSEKEISIKFKDAISFAMELEKNGFWTLDLVVKSVNLNSPADKSGIKAGDIFSKINGVKVISFEDLRDSLQKSNQREVEVEIIQSGKSNKLRLTPEEQMVEGKKLKLLGVYSLIEIEPIQFINTKSKGIVGSAYFGLVRTWDSFKKTLDGFYKIVTNQVSFKAVGGVFTIGKVANDSFKISFSYFLQLMALISINLGVINLFPMLPLDGGHIMFIFLELINRGPVSRRKMEIAQQIGLSILLMLMVGSIFNDVSRFF
jgi:regulator of sigma E protease